MNWLKELDEPRRENVFAAMRRIDERAQQDEAHSRSRSPSWPGSIPVGAEYIDGRINADGAYAFLRALRQGKDPSEALKIATDEARSIVEAHNRRMGRDYILKRSEISGQARIEWGWRLVLDAAKTAEEPVTRNARMTLYQKHRPAKIGDLKGQPDAVAQLKDMHKRDTFPHAILLTGDSGCGKTTIARILRTRLKCSEHDFVEKNAAEVRGIDAIRDIAGRMTLSPMGGDSRIYLLDEAQQLTKDAQSALLKLLEDTPPHVYFMLATTDPQKLLPTIRTRCTTIAVRPLPLPAMRELLYEVAEKEGVPDPDPKLLDKIAEIAQGSARKGLVLLEQVLWLTDEKEQYSILGKADLEHQAFAVAKDIVNGAAWPQVAIKLRALKDEDAEGMRRMMLAFFTTCVLNNGKDVKRCGTILGIFASQNTYDSGWPGFVNACYKASEVK